MLYLGINRPAFEILLSAFNRGWPRKRTRFLVVKMCLVCINWTCRQTYLCSKFAVTQGCVSYCLDLGMTCYSIPEHTVDGLMQNHWDAELRSAVNNSSIIDALNAHVLLDDVNNSFTQEMIVESVLNNLGNDVRSCRLLLWDELVKAAETIRSCTKRP